jgi:YVTN family beta-propeller protein
MNRGRQLVIALTVISALSGCAGRPAQTPPPATATAGFTAPPTLGATPTQPTVEPTEQPTASAVPSLIDVGHGPIGIAEAGGSIWVATYFDGALVRIDPQTRALLEPVAVGLGAIGVAAAAGSLWVTLHELGQVARVDPTSGEVIAVIDVGEQPEGVAGDDAGVWVTLEESGEVLRIDPATNEPDPPIAVGREPRHVGLGFGSVWVTNFGSSTVSRIDPQTSAVTTIEVQFGPEGIAFDDDGVWIAHVREGTLVEIDAATNRTLVGFTTGPGSEGVIVGSDGTIWVAVAGENEVLGLAHAGSRHVPVGAEPRRLLIRGNDLWVVNTGDGTVSVVPIPPLEPDAAASPTPLAQ